MSTLNVSNITDGTTTVGTSYVVNGSAKVWCNWTDTGSINDSLNMSSVTDNGAGDFTVNYSSSMSSTSYAPVMSGEATYSGSAVFASYSDTAKTVSSMPVYSYASVGGGNIDCPEYGLSIFGDLA